MDTASKCMFSNQKVTMEWGLYEDHVANAALFRCGYATLKIHAVLQQLKLNLCVIRCNIKRYKETANINNRVRSGHPLIAPTKEVVKADWA